MSTKSFPAKIRLNISVIASFIFFAQLLGAYCSSISFAQVDSDQGLSTQGTSFAQSGWRYPVLPYESGSYGNRTFFCCEDSSLGRHLGEDMALAEGTAIRAIGPGEIKIYRAADGYGELVVVIEHDLGQLYNFTNGYGNPVSTRHILSIYGHLRKSKDRGGPELGFAVGHRVQGGEVIGYVNDALHNGDGGAHLHMGIRLSDAATAQERDPTAWFRGYERSTGLGTDFGAASAVISRLLSPYDGYLDNVGCETIDGWAWDNTSTPVTVNIYDGANQIATVLANTYRSDLDGVVGNGQHSFSIPTPVSLKDGQTHSVWAKIAGPEHNLSFSPKSVSCGYVGYVDVANCDVIRGWAADRNRPNTSINVKIYDGNTLVTTVLADQPRSDVGAVLGDNGLHGFNIPTPASLRNGQSHNVSVRFESAAEGLTNSPTTISCGTQQPNYVGYVDVADCNVIRGWAADWNRPGVSLNVTVYDGNTALTTVTANQHRPDVGGVLGDNGLHGFNIPTPDSLRTGTHSISVKFELSSTHLSNSPTSLTCAAQPNYVGYVDLADCNVIRGWAADRNRPNTSINVSIYDGASLVTTVLANQSRADVGSALGDNGLHGFNIPTPASLKTGTHSVSVRYEASGSDLNNSPKSLSCTPSYVGYVDLADCNVIRGWAADRNRLNTSINVSIYDGDTFVTTAQANQSRADVGAALGDNGLHGFNIATPTSLRSGTHNVRVKFESGTTNLNNSPWALNCNSSPPSISSTSPSSPNANGSDQDVTVSGSNFQSGLTVDISFPFGGGTTLSGAQILNVTPDSFVMRAVLGASGQWSIRVRNPDNQLSNSFNFTVNPRITSISPASPTRSNVDQNVTVNGNGFQNGLTVFITFPSGGGTTLSGAQIKNVTGNSFVMVATLSAAGNWSIRVNNPNGTQSNTRGFTVQ